MRQALVGIGLALVCAWSLAAPPSEADERPAAASRPMLWVSKSEPRVHLFGTLQVPDARAQALTPAVETALEESYLYLTDLPSGSADLARLEAQAKRLSALPPEVGGLRKLLGDELHGRVSKLVGSSFSVNTLESREPWYARRELVRAVVAQACPQPAKLLSHDLWDRAKLEGVPVAGLDTAPEYLEVFDALSTDEQVAWLRATVERCEQDAKAEVKYHERLVRAYLAGDAAQVQALWRETLPPDELGAKLGSALLRDRVRRMLGRFAARRKREPDLEIFLALDAALLAGETGVLKALAQQGLEMRRVE